MKVHPATPERCGLTTSEAARILAPLKVVDEVAEGTPEWKQVCIDAYVQCKEEKWLGSCYDCFRYCEGQQEWPVDKCRRRKGGN